MTAPQLTTAELELENAFCNWLANPKFETPGARLQLLDLMLRHFVLGDGNKKWPQPLDTRPLEPFMRRMKQLLDTPGARRGFLEKMTADLLPPEMPTIQRVLINHVIQDLLDTDERNSGSSTRG